jgi:hypothetical protein
MRLRIIAFAFIVSLFSGVVLAQTYSFQTTSVTSSTVPVNVMPAGTKKTWCITPRSAATVPVDCFAYQGAIPTGVPSPAAIQEITAAKSFCDELSFAADPTINSAWACVLSTGSTAVTVDSTWRGAE